jgi:predicted pyridoxine 5'-phosphate oxidase superfamily flavin-nucleotide-binding protein
MSVIRDKNGAGLMARAFAEIAFTPKVRAVQKSMGSAGSYAAFLDPEADRSDRLGDAEADFIAARDGFYQATISESGWPYVQFRGGPAGFVKVLDEKTIAYADFRGNRQYLSAGNLDGNDRVSLILMDYPNRRRLKIWGRAKLVDAKDDPQLLARLQDKSYRGLPERAVVISVEAVDWNCPQHIPQRLTMQELEPLISPLRDEIDRLKAENESLKTWLGQKS